MYTYDDFGSVIIYGSRPYKQKKIGSFHSFRSNIIDKKETHVYLTIS